MCTRKLLRIFAAILVLISCQKEKNPIVQGEMEFEFPLAIGTSWEYAIVNETIHTYSGDREVSHDTAEVVIARSTVTANGKNVLIWQVRFKNSQDTLFVYRSPDSLLFYADSNLQRLKFGLVFPLKESREWRLGFSTYQVFWKDTLNTPFSLLKNVLQVNEYPSFEGNVYGWNEYHLFSRIGIVKYRFGFFYTLTDTNYRSTWLLLSYQPAGQSSSPPLPAKPE